MYIAVFYLLIKAEQPFFDGQIIYIIYWLGWLTMELLLNWQPIITKHTCTVLYI